MKGSWVMIHILAQFSVKEDKVSEFIELCKELIKESQRLSGVHSKFKRWDKDLYIGLYSWLKEINPASAAIFDHSRANFLSSSLR